MTLLLLVCCEITLTKKFSSSMPLLSYYHHSDPDFWAAYPQAEAIRTAGVLLRTRRAAVGGLEKTILSLLVIIIISLSVTVYGLGVETESGSTASKHKANRFTYTSMCIYTHTHMWETEGVYDLCVFSVLSVFLCTFHFHSSKKLHRHYLKSCERPTTGNVQLT